MDVPTSKNLIPPEYIRCLQKTFGHSSFRKKQWEIISSFLFSKRDNCVIMATGYGKSLCYQFPSVYLAGTITLVVSPLISLMQDQVLAMCSCNVRACYLGSAQKKFEIVREVIAGRYSLVYVTPEYITSENGEYLIISIRDKLILIAIDEAHCVSKWGHDFRPHYRNLDCLRSLCPLVPILALTATANKQVRDDIIKNLQLRNAQIVTTSFDRPNLEFIVKKKTEIWADIGPYIQDVQNGSILVYCTTNENSDYVASLIQLKTDQKVGIYHADKPLEKREETHVNFINNCIRIVVATIAFGMGINKPDIRLVVHYGATKDVESYYQIIGRAGRDGLPAKCVMFYSREELQLVRRGKEEQISKSEQENRKRLMRLMSKYVKTPNCRRRFLLKYFGEDCDDLPTRADCCDNCRQSNSINQPSTLAKAISNSTKRAATSFAPSTLDIHCTKSVCTDIARNLHHPEQKLTISISDGIEIHYNPTRALSSPLLCPESSLVPMQPTALSPRAVKRPKMQCDEADEHLFQSYAATFEKFSEKNKVSVKLELAKLFADTELKEIDERL